MRKLIFLLGVGLLPTAVFAQTTVTYSDTPGAAVTVPDNGCGTATYLNRTINVPENLLITDVNVGFRGTNTRRGEIQVWLISPTGTMVQVINGNLGDTNDNYDLLLDSSSGNALNDGSNDSTAAPNYAADRTAAPSNSLNAFNGLLSSGNWTVRICDSTGDSGRGTTFVGAQLVITGTPANTISGTVFRDYNADGAQGTYEPGVSGVTVTAYYNVAPFTASTTTNASGAYSISSTAGTGARVEFSNLPSTVQPGPATATGNYTTVNFITVPATVNLAVANPGQHTQLSPNIMTSCYVFGPQPSKNTAAFDLFISFPYDAGCVDANLNGTCDTAGDDVDDPMSTHLANGAQVGTTWGIAYDPNNDSTFLASFMKRHTGFRANGETGRIYRLDGIRANGSPTSVSTYVSVSNAGTDPHPADNGTDTQWSIDQNSWDPVGKVGLGGVAISDDRQTLYTINLAQRTLLRIPVLPPGQTPTAGQIVSVNLPSPADCTANATNLRPFAVKFHEGLVYIGMVCSGESTQSAATLRFYVYSYRPSDGLFTQVLNFAGNYSRENAIEDDDGSTTDDTPADWRPWTPTFTALPAPFSNGDTGNPQPMLTDIEFDHTGAMILGIRDRSGDQFGFDERSTNPAVTTLYRGNAAGDLLRACPNGGGGWTIESNGSCGGVTTPGAGTGEGPGNGEFYYQEHYPYHDEVSAGGILVVLGNREVLTTGVDPIFNTSNDDAYSGGVFWHDNLDGSRNKSFRVYPRTMVGNFAKANGLGDLEALANPAPIEIGNRVWVDTDLDGVQDPVESGISGVTVRLYQGSGLGATLVGTSVTNSTGRYLFNSSNVTGGILRNTAYEIRLDNAADYSLGGPLSGRVVTTANATEDQRDNDGVLGNGVMATLTTGGAGSNNHTYDFGFVPGVPLWVDLMSFRAERLPNDMVQLTWVTAVEIDNVGFRVYRAVQDESGDWIRGEEVTTSVIPSESDGSSDTTYIFVDEDPVVVTRAGERTSSYVLEDIDVSGKLTLHGPATAVFPKQDNASLPNESWLLFD